MNREEKKDEEREKEDKTYKNRKLSAAEVSRAENRIEISSSK